MIIIFLQVSLLATSAYICYLYTVLKFYFYRRDKILKKYDITVLILSFSLFLSSRELFATYNDDFDTYYKVYRDVVTGSVDLFHRFGYEVGINLINFALKVILFEYTLPPRLYLFFLLVLQFSLFYYCTVRYKVLHVVNKERLLIALIFLSFPYLLPSLYLRQAFSLVFFLLFALQNGRMKYFFLIFSLLFHYSVILVIPFYVLYKKRWLNNSGILVLCFLLFFSAISLGSELVKSSRYYFIWQQLDYKFSFFSVINYYKFLFVALLLSIFFRKEAFRFLFFLTLLIFTVEFYFPTLSFRVFMWVVFYSGFLLFIVLDRAPLIVSISVITLLVLLRLYSVSLNDTDFKPFQDLDGVVHEPFKYIEALVDTKYNSRRD